MRDRKYLPSSFLFLLLISTGIFSPSSLAHERNYVWTYQYATALKGEREFEYYLTQEIPEISRSEWNHWQHWLEFEYGITDRWDISFYQMFRQINDGTSGSKFFYEGYKLRTRYRFGEEGTYLIDPLLYLEWIDSAHRDFEDRIEFKLVLGKQLKRWNISYNEILEQSLSGDHETEHEYAFGISFEISSFLYLGMESKGNFTEGTSSAGPTLSLRTDDHWWITIGSQYGMNSRSKDFQIRAIMGIEF